jgi:uncharacterized phage protein (TIGR01671 family)
MSREIKFRAWDNNGKESRMYYPGDFTDDGSALILNMFGDLLEARKLEKGNKTPDAAYNHAIYPARIGHNLTLMQYTGLKDRNGVEIYEGDILGYEGFTGFVEYDSPEFIINDMIWTMTECEVIGNIYENKDKL